LLRCAWCPAEIIGYAVWLSFHFPLSLRMVEAMLAARGILVSHETVRPWGLKFGREIATALRRRAPRRGDTWHLDEVVITIAGQKHGLWRAVDQEGFVLDILVQSRRDAKAAKRLARASCSRSKAGQDSAFCATGGFAHRSGYRLITHSPGHDLFHSPLRKSV
jgi:transposase-like protein